MKFRAVLLLLAVLGVCVAAGSAPARAQKPDEGAALLEAGAKSLAAGEYENAARHLSRAMRSDALTTAQIAKALFQRGLAFRNLERPAQAISDFTSALWLQGLSKSELAQAYLNRGLAYEAVGMGDLAKADLRRAREIDPNSQVVAQAKPRKPGPTINAFETEVQTAERKPSRPPVPDFQTRVTETREPPARPVPSFQTEVTPTEKPVQRKAEPRVPVATFQTEVRVAERKPEPVPSFRTSILPDEPANKPAPRKPHPAPVPPPPDWNTSVDTDPNKPAAPDNADRDKEKPGKVSRFFNGLWKSKSDEKEAKAERPEPPLASKWTQTTKVDASGKTPAPATPSGRSYRIQLAALRSEEEAQSTWQRLSSRHQNLLAGRAPTIEKTDLGSLGTFYRIQIGPFAEKRESQELCNSLKRSGIDCFLVAR